MNHIEVTVVDFHNQQHQQDLILLLDSYAQDPMGGGQPLSEFSRQNLINHLKQMPHAISFLCYQDNQPIGFANCFFGFSTFKCKPLLNIHDFAIIKAIRGQNISQQLLQKIESTAREKGCCKITLEVLEGNVIAQKAYLKYGFDNYQLDPEMGKAEFWEKTL